MSFLSDKPDQPRTANLPKSRAWALLTLGTILLASVYFLLALNARLTIEPLPAGHPLPPIELFTSSGNSFPVSSLQGKMAILLFFTIECPHCLQALSNLERLTQLYGERLAIISISLSKEDKTAAFAAARKFSFPVLLTDRSKARKLFKIGSVPALFLFDERQKLKLVRLGTSILEPDNSLGLVFPTDASTGKAK